jgi:hypothetical protein
MKLELTEVLFIKESMTHVTIKAINAPQVAKLIDKIDKEIDRLEKAQLSEIPD